MGNDIQDLRNSFFHELSEVHSSSDLERLRVAFLGKTGMLTKKLRELCALAPEERRHYGTSINQLRDEITIRLESEKASLGVKEIEETMMSERIDVTLPAAHSLSYGSEHILTSVQRKIRTILESLGLIEANVWNEIDDDFHNFTGLNIPATHPAREMHDTFYVSPAAIFGKEWRQNAIDSALYSHSDHQELLHDISKISLLRTHTTTTEIRDLIARVDAPNAKIFSLGSVYRADYDSTHLPMFSQVECVYLNENITVANMKWFVEEFLRMFFDGMNLELRFRNSYFPFTEPSMEVDLRIKGKKEWLEIMGCGMLHRNVLNCIAQQRKIKHGRDNDVSTLNEDWSNVRGFAFGSGIERMTMIRYGFDDIRKLYMNDIRWIKNYSNLPTVF